MIRQALVRFGLRFADDAQEKLFVERFVLVHLRTSQLFLMATWPPPSSASAPSAGRGHCAMFRTGKTQFGRMKWQV
jgi:hypothetical protein